MSQSQDPLGEQLTLYKTCCGMVQGVPSLDRFIAPGRGRRGYYSCSFSFLVDCLFIKGGCLLKEGCYLSELS